MAITQAVQEAWNVNLQVNAALAEHLTPQMLEAKTPGDGFTVAQHLAHITASVKYWGSLMDKRQLQLPDLFPEDQDPDSLEFRPEMDLTIIRKVMAQTASQTLESCRNAPNKGELPHASLDAYLIHMMVHDAHHRGQIMLALKTSGRSLPDDEKVWGPWRGGQA